MVYLYICSACERGDHAHCEKGHPAQAGVFGGSKCKCLNSHHQAMTDPKAAVERLRRWLNEDDCKYAGDIETALAYIDELKRAKEELVRTGEPILEAFYAPPQSGLWDDWRSFRAALQRHKE